MNVLSYLKTMSTEAKTETFAPPPHQHCTNNTSSAPQTNTKLDGMCRHDRIDLLNFWRICESFNGGNMQGWLMELWIP